MACNSTLWHESDWIPSTVAARLIPSPHGGTVHPATVVRWVLKGRIEGRRRGRWWFVRRSEVLAMLQPVKLELASGEARKRKRLDGWTRERLEEFGL